MKATAQLLYELHLMTQDWKMQPDPKGSTLLFSSSVLSPHPQNM
jgi:hypothetical protein